MKMATRVLNCRVTIGGYKPFNAIHDIKVVKSINNIMDTAVIKVPASALLRAEKTEGTTYKRIDTNYAFKNGDKVVIELGYDGKYRKEFEGFVQSVGKSIPCVLECEGYGYQLRRLQIKKVYEKAALKAVLTDIIAGTDILLHPDNDDVELDKLELLPQDRLQALQEIRKQLADGVNIWFEGRYLRLGLKYLTLTELNRNNKPDVVLKTGWNYVREGTLKARLAGDKAYEVQLVTKDEKGKEEKVTAGTPNSNVERKKITAIKNALEKERLAKGIHSSKDYTGVEGDVITFLEPATQPGWKVRIIDERYPELSGDYLCEEVETSFGRSGGRRKVKLTYKLGN